MHNKLTVTAGLSVESRDDYLDSWKQIALYLRREVRTVQRWEKREALPIHRHVHLKGCSVYAFTGEIDAWRKGREQANSALHLVPDESKHSADGDPFEHQNRLLLTPPSPTKDRECVGCRCDCTIGNTVLGG